MVSIFNTGPGVFLRAMTGKNFATIADAFGIGFFAAGFFALCLSTGSAALTSDLATASRVMSLGLLVAGASAVCGWLLGLLFGIPRTLARPQPVATGQGGRPSDEGKAKPASRVNTNLEDVSDWLTKTLIGVGLTQLYLLPEKIWSVAGLINTAGFGWTPYGQLLGVGLMLYFMPGGFWLGYVATRTILTKLFDSIEEAGADAEIVLAKDQLQLSVEGRRIAAATDPEVIRADRALLRLPVYAMETPRQLAAWGVARARADQLAKGVIALEEAHDADPADPVIKEVLAKLYTVQDRGPEAEGIIKDAPEMDISVFWALYQPPPEGFSRAIAIGEKLLTQSGQKANANLRVWLASAYGQQHEYALTKNDQDKAKAARVKVVENVQAAIAADARVRPMIHALWKPAPGSLDDDLASIPGDDPDLTRLLG